MFSTDQLDLRRMLCPLPVIRTQDHIKGMSPGDTLTIVCTDPGVLTDIPTWCRINGHEVTSTEEADYEIKITIQVGAE
ncbi:MAG: SirA family protein [Gammaproteobacteria bacterium]|uniref:SirA family protein n=1 Tax=OM182 bacterium MED-G24 TaxID=1986255 RepID=A0A2A5WTA9_9GAMM|nr:SirA family protein [Gammaproteobacteria bacterium]PDH39719.1 MAG: SirA family protein [OM182 bacterium MED-G24]RPG27437.1 MAG: sulfurtransferase TusA family protein [Gammaproteobacteria bacterium TMED50]|tara:strand:+ start:812 stop:1045 length:234 start_codon:yes stop_codon:yes gene_type:complete